MPDFDDRNLVGKSANLSDEQIKELSKLPTGVAAVYQNDWLEPVLCKVDYRKMNGFYRMTEKKEINYDNSQKTILLSLLDKMAGEKLDYTVGELTNIILTSSLPTKLKVKAVNVIQQNGKARLSDISSIVYDMVCDSETKRIADESDNLDEWKNTIIFKENSIVADLDENIQNTILKCIINEQIERFNSPREYLDIWDEYVREEVY